eukprot:TRINITY_DN6258_c0_g1_i1.p1 TRINITY_DN6258_c0_g1~~TRINITY_DN6258_c0_g1_i1.p1  ORF type:complete len:107 (+),score=29.67 TRINITY_DN6258_c0_g1_i1:51-323(+)
MPPVDDIFEDEPLWDDEEVRAERPMTAMRSALPVAAVPQFQRQLHQALLSFRIRKLVFAILWLNNSPSGQSPLRAPEVWLRGFANRTAVA